ncbi:MAG: alpha/beta fold hydrolase [bacterium]|nr:alpha/beta fold hydrolase [bacterium]
MSAALTLPPGVGICHLPADFSLASGEELPGAVVAYELDGPRDAPVVAVLGGISADRRPVSWWRGVVGRDLAVDTSRFAVLSIDWLGGHGCSTGPGPGESFPFVSTGDQARALRAVLDHLGVERLHALIGASYGGMIALQLAAIAPERVRELAVVAAAERSHPQASAWRWLQREVVLLAQRGGEGQRGVELARALAMATYRSPAELAERFSESSALFDWLRARGRAFADQVSAEQFRVLNASIDAHRVDPRAVRVRSTLVGFDSDQLVPAADVERVARALPELAAHVVIPTRYGHDGFLKETAAVSGVLAEVLR